MNDSGELDLQRVATEAMKKGLSVGRWSTKQAGAFLTDFEAQIRDLGLQEQREQVGGVKALTIWPESAEACLDQYRRRIRGGGS